MNKKSILILGICTYSVLLFLAIFFFKERTVFLDLAYHLFSILKDQNFAIQNNRFGAMFTQAFPFAGMHLDCSLRTIALLYSASFILLYSATFFSILLIQKNTKIALAYLIFGLIITTHTFYWAQSELPQATAFLFLYLGLLDNALSRGVGIKYWLFALPLLIVICFTHPLMVFAVSFCFLFFLLSYPQSKKKILYSFGLYLLITIIKANFFKTEYDNQAFKGLDNVASLFPHYLNIKSNHNLLAYLKNDYYLLIIGLLSVLFYYSRNRNFLKAGLVAGFCFTYTFIVNITYHTGVEQFYIENQYLLLGLFVGLPLSYDIFPTIKMKHLSLMLVSAGVILSLIRIYNTRSMYTDRLNWNRTVLKTTATLSKKKIVIRKENVPNSLLLMTWGSCYEFWLLSTLEGKESRSLIIEQPDNNFAWAMTEQYKFITLWGVFPYKDFPKHYFKFNDSSAYQYYTLPQQ